MRLSIQSPPTCFPTDDTISQRGGSYSYFPLHKKATNVFHFVLIFFVLLSLPWTGNAFFYRNEWISKFLFHIHPQSSSSAIYPYPPVHSGRGYAKFRRVKVFKPPLVSFKVFLLFDFYSQNDFWSGEVEHKNSIMIMKTTQTEQKTLRKRDSGGEREREQRTSLTKSWLLGRTGYCSFTCTINRQTIR